MPSTAPIGAGTNPSTAVLLEATSQPATSSSGGNQWRVFLGLAMLVASYVFRVEIVRFSLRLVRRALPGMVVWIEEFEKNLLKPLAWVVFVLMIWLSAYVMDLSDLLNVKAATIASIVTLLMGFPLVWVVICLCNYVTWGIVRIQGWNRTASKYEDDYSRVMIITEGISVIKILLIAGVLSSCVIDQLGYLSSLDTSQISTVAVLMIEMVFVFGSHTWIKNIMGGLIALTDEQLRGGSHVRFQGQEGVVERLFLQCFSLRRYDKGLAYIPNGILLENMFEVDGKSFDKRHVIPIRLDKKTKSAAIRVFIQEVDDYLTKYFTEKLEQSKSKGLGLSKLPKASDIADLYARMKGAAAQGVKQPQQQFWITVEGPHLVQVVFYTQERHMKERIAEKSEVILHLTEILNRMKLKVHCATKQPNEEPPSRPKAQTARARDDSFIGKTDTSHIPRPPPSAPALGHLNLAQVDEDGLRRRRRQPTS